MKDIVERLNGAGAFRSGRPFSDLCREAADYIKELRLALEQQSLLPCPSCNKFVNLSNYGRCWHCGERLSREMFLKSVNEKMLTPKTTKAPFGALEVPHGEA